MRIRTLIYYITTGFVIGIITLLTVQYITSTNIRELISGNENLLKEYQLSNELVRLQNGVLLLDNKIKTVAITGDSNKKKDFEIGVRKIREEVRALDHSIDPYTTSGYMNELQRLINQKIDLSHQLVDSISKAGKPVSESIVVNSRAIKLSEEITRLTHKIDTTGKIVLSKRIQAVDLSGQRVLNWNLYVIFLVLFLLTAVFLIIVSRMKKQADLINQLNTSEKKLKKAALIQENFLANMSHEIRTPLNAILGYTRLLQRKKLDEDSRLHLETVHQSGETLLSLVNDILDLSKIESGMMRVEEVPFNLAGLVHSITAMFHHKVEEKGLTLTTSLPADMPADTLIGDPTRLTQILANLLGNAIKFTSKGEILLNVHKKNVDVSHIEMEFVVSDTGIGIEEDKLDTIFERFRQAEDSTTRKFGGTGLGLSIVRDLVYLQYGSIEVQSKAGSGTTVRFNIPYMVSAQPPQTDHLEINKSKSGFAKNQKVLIVEDNVINQGVVAHMLQDWTIKNKVAGNGKDAIEILRTEQFDLVLMDIQMPEMDGYMATTEIRENLKLNIPVVAMTAHAMAGQREKCISYGMNEHISKPIRENDLRRVLSMFLISDVADQPEKQSLRTAENDYQIIDLSYMKEISNGDLEYEKLVTQQFLDLVPAQIAALSAALSERKGTEIKRIAHNLKTSISIMGIDALLSQDLDAVENGDLDEHQTQKSIDTIISVCSAALHEAGIFYSHF